MPDDQEPAEAKLNAANPIALSDLRSDLDNAVSRVVKGTVTVTWPYSIIRHTLAFNLVDTHASGTGRSQVHVEFQGRCAKEVHEARCGAGDEVTLSLDGAECTGTGHGKDKLQLRFCKSVLMQVREL